MADSGVEAAVELVGGGEVVERLEMAGIEFCGAAAGCDGLVVAFQFFENDAQIIVGRDQFRVEFDGTAKSRHGFVEAAGLA